jgi:hypothetical protein
LGGGLKPNGEQAATQTLRIINAEDTGVYGVSTGFIGPGLIGKEEFNERSG